MARLPVRLFQPRTSTAARRGPGRRDPWAALVLHAQDELSHHDAEVTLLRDLYRQQA
jgi:hypothetical protein